MKYILLIYDNANTRETFLGENGEALMAEIDAIMKELTESGELVGGKRWPILRTPGRSASSTAPRPSPTVRSPRPRSTWAAT